MIIPLPRLRVFQDLSQEEAFYIVELCPSIVKEAIEDEAYIMYLHPDTHFSEELALENIKSILEE